MLTFSARRLFGSNFTKILPQFKDITRQMSKHFVFNEIQGDLFGAPNRYSLAHSVPADMDMSAGISARFRETFGQIQELMSQNVKKGGVAVLEDEDRYIYYLVTKDHAQDKATYPILRSSLSAMKGHAVKHKVQYLAMPRIGCGIDGLDWEKVKNEITSVFRRLHICITIYNYAPK